MPANSRFARIRSLTTGSVTLALLVTLSGCDSDTRMVTELSATPVFAKGSAGATVVEVSSVSPTEAPADTTLLVVVSGKNFAKGAAAKWSIAGDTSRVHVLSTSYVNGNQLKALVQVPADAPLGAYDVEVYLADGKKGVGVEMFTVQRKQPTQVPVAATFGIPATGYSLSSSGGDSYADGVCGVMARVFYLMPEYQDANMQLDNPRTKDRSCGSGARKLTITYPDNGAVQTNSGDMNIALLGTVTQFGGPQERSMSISLAGSTSRCTRISLGGNLLGGTKVMVTRLSETQWSVRSQTGGISICLRPDGTTQSIVNFNVALTVTLN